MKKKKDKAVDQYKRVKDSIKLFQLLPNQYEIDVFLCVSELPTPEIIPYLNETLDLGFDYDTLRNFDADCPMTIFSAKLPKAVVVLRSVDNVIDYSSILAHELMHVATFISAVVDININHEETSEVWAYFMSFYMTVCMEIVSRYKEWKREEEKKAKAKAKKRREIKKKKKEAKEEEENQVKVKIKTETTPKRPKKRDKEKLDQLLEELEDKPKKKPTKRTKKKENVNEQ